MQTEEAGTPGDPSQFCHLLAVSLWAGAWPLLSLCFLGGTLRRKWGRLWFSILRCAFGNRLDGRYSNPDESRSLTFNSWWPDFPYLAGNGLIGWESKTRAGAWARGAFSVLWLRWVWALWVGIGRTILPVCDTGSCFMTCSLSHNMQLSHLLGWNNLPPAWSLCLCPRQWLSPIPRCWDHGGRELCQLLSSGWWGMFPRLCLCHSHLLYSFGISF